MTYCRQASAEHALAGSRPVVQPQPLVAQAMEEVQHITVAHALARGPKEGHITAERGGVGVHIYSPKQDEPACLTALAPSHALPAFQKQGSLPKTCLMVHARIESTLHTCACSAARSEFRRPMQAALGHLEWHA